jgi:hypothetical protein
MSTSGELYGTIPNVIALLSCHLLVIIRKIAGVSDKQSTLILKPDYSIMFNLYWSLS